MEMEREQRWQCGWSRRLELGSRGEIMGILNVTPDSFSDGGAFAAAGPAVAHALAMLDAGARIIDVGGESTRPGAAPVSREEEEKRVLPVIEALVAARPEALVSIDTSKAEVAGAACRAGAAIINDVTGLTGDVRMAEIARETGAGVVIMHMQGTPRSMQQSPSYRDVVAEVRDFFERRFESAVAAGIAPQAIVFDPGIGFGKNLDHNLALIRNLDRLAVAGRPLLLGVSRKSFLGKIIGGEDIPARVGPTAVVTAYARRMGVRLHRVHDVRINLDALRVAEALMSEG
jgi:dihydropteroate synthase